MLPTSSKKFTKESVLLLPQEIVQSELTKPLLALRPTAMRTTHVTSSACELLGSSKDHTISKPKEDASKRWERRARSHLFRSKRAVTLAGMLRARMVFAALLGNDPSVEDIRHVSLRDPDRARCRFGSVLRRAKATRVGIALADITVCGAVPPYNSILGGKVSVNARRQP